MIWKVIHRILAVKDALLRRKVSIDPGCPFCELETIEHLFLNCDFARRISRASHLGFDFSMGNPIGFTTWFDGWIRHAPDKELIQESILIMWSIWCKHNDVLFKSAKAEVDSV